MASYHYTRKDLDSEQEKLERFNIWETIKVLKNHYISVRVDHVPNYWGGLFAHEISPIERNYVVRVLDKNLTLNEAQKLAEHLKGGKDE